ncbi:hypothetical protein KXX32_000999, partial [Aspergillus fumigatus]
MSADPPENGWPSKEDESLSSIDSNARPRRASATTRRSRRKKDDDADVTQKNLA